MIQVPIRDVTKYKYIILIDHIMSSKWMQMQIEIGGTLFACECLHIKLMEETKSKLHDAFA